MRKVVVAEFVSLDGLFKDGIDETVLHLVDTKAFDSGVVAVNYRPAGREGVG